jgi:3-phosphoshikimate 1-carboxyvinyltransferase
MIYTIQAPPNIQARIHLPASKSISNRVLILNALSKSNQPIENLSDSDDTQVMLRVFQSQSANFDIGAAGTSMRFLTAYLSQLEGNWTITGTERMKNRPIQILVDALREIGAEIEYLEKAGFPPLHIHGKKLTGGNICLNGSVSSQYISALMMIAPCTQQGLEIQLQAPVVSKPYIEMTIRLMQIFGIKTFWDEQNIRIEPQTYRPVPYKVESDWSAASYWYEIALLAEKANIELLGLAEESIQGDAKCTAIFEKFGIRTKFDKEKAVIANNSVIGSTSHTPLFYDFTDEPDLAQTFVVSCCLSETPFHFTGLQSLRIKETDRIAALQTELKKLGFLVNADNASMEWGGEHCEPERHPVIATYEDHRMAMAFAPACLKTGEIEIKDPGVVSKSYPGFWDDLEKAGFVITKR